MLSFYILSALGSYALWMAEMLHKLAHYNNGKLIADFSFTCESCFFAGMISRKCRIADGTL
jgi:hypothetical protein